MTQSFDLDSVIVAMTSATEEVFATMLALPIETGATYHEKATSSSGFDGLVALVGLAGTWIGTGRISMGGSLACKLAGQMLMTEYPAVNEDVLDAIAEVANMVFGNVKTSLEEHLGPMGLSIPTVIYGRNYHTRSMGAAEWLVAPFECGGERMEVKLCLLPASEGHSHRHPDPALMSAGSHTVAPPVVHLEP